MSVQMLDTATREEAEALAVSLVVAEAIPDPYPMYARLREIAPVFRSESLGGMWLVTGHPECEEAIHSTALGQGPAEFQRIRQDPRFERSAYLHVLMDMLPFIDPPQHTRLRRLVSRAFTPRRVEALRPYIEQRVDELLDELAESFAEHGSVDLVTEFSAEIPVSAICEMVGVPIEYHERFIGWTRLLAAASGAVMTDEAIAGADTATRNFGDALAELAEARRRQPQDDMLTDLVRAGDDGETLTPNELHSTFMSLIGAGVETAVNLMAAAFVALDRFPEAAESLRSGRVDDEVADEFLRYDPPLQTTFPRLALHDTVLAGHPLKQWDVINPIIGATGRDPRVFDRPDDLDLARPRVGKPLGFGGGLHYCLGAAMGRLEVNIAVPRFTRRFPDMKIVAPPARRGNVMVRGIGELRASLDG